MSYEVRSVIVCLRVLCESMQLCVYVCVCGWVGCSFGGLYSSQSTRLKTSTQANFSSNQSATYSSRGSGRRSIASGTSAVVSTSVAGARVSVPVIQPMLKRIRVKCQVEVVQQPQQVEAPSQFDGRGLRQSSYRTCIVTWLVR